MKTHRLFFACSVNLSTGIALALFLAMAGLGISTTHAGAPAKGANPPPDTGLDGAKLWAQTCTQCHNVRPAKEFSNAQWDVIVHHMQVRAKLTLTESHAIAEFLKQGK